MDRAEFLRRVREATGRAEGAAVPGPPALPGVAPAVPGPALAERFAAELNAVLGNAHVVRDEAEAREVLAGLLEGAATFVRSPHGVLDAVGLPELTAGLREVTPDLADVGVTGAEFAVAETGSVVLSSVWGRLAALLPYRHVVVVRAEQIVPDLQGAYVRLTAGDLPAAWGFHTGPSKSADIEQTMALGVHGPGRVDVIVLLEG